MTAAPIKNGCGDMHLHSSTPMASGEVQTRSSPTSQLGVCNAAAKQETLPQLGQKREPTLKSCLVTSICIV